MVNKNDVYFYDDATISDLLKITKDNYAVNFSLLKKNFDERIGTISYEVTKENHFQAFNINSKLNQDTIVIYISEISILRKYRNMRFGRYLIEKFIETKTKENSNIIFILYASPDYDTLSLKKLIEFYKEFGFELINKNVNYDMAPMILIN